MPMPEQQEIPEEHKKLLKEIFGSATKCAQCGMDIGMLMIARIAIECHGHHFCCALCAEDWLDEHI